MKKVLLSSLSILSSVFISLNAQADLVFNQPPFTTAGMLVSSPGVYYPSPPGVTIPGGRVFDDFTLSSPANITGITWWGYYSPTYSAVDAFTVTFYTDNGVSPPSVSPYEVSYGSLTVGNYTLKDGIAISQYEVTLDSDKAFPAAANTKYWLSIYNGALNWGWQIADPLYCVDSSGSIQNPQLGDQSNVAFQLTGSPVPIPPTAWLLASGLVALVVIRRREK